jgi:hypothetical protein
MTAKVNIAPHILIIHQFTLIRAFLGRVGKIRKDFSSSGAQAPLNLAAISIVGYF